MKTPRGTLLAAATLLFTLRISAATLHVSLSCTNPLPPYDSWSTAATNIQDAVSVAAPGDDIWVAKGTYFENVTISNGLAFYGGFAGSETDLSQRDWASHATVIDGGQSNTVIRIVQPMFDPRPTRVDGFVIQNGVGETGGGIAVVLNYPVVIANNRIVRNQASSGGGIFCAAFLEPVIITNNIIQQNQGGTGGGVYCANYSRPTIANNLILQNQATNGGGIACGYVQAIICSNLIQDNLAQSAGGGVHITQAYRDTQRVTIRNNRIIGNQSVTANGAGIYSWYGLMDIIGNVILGNTALADGASGSGIFASSPASIAIFNNTIIGNQSARHDYAIGTPCVFSTRPLDVANNVIAYNSAGVYCLDGALRNNCFFGNATNDTDGRFDTNANNLYQDPRLVWNPMCPLLPGSPCIDAGLTNVVQTGALDIKGSSRISGASVDIGADEFVGATPDFPRSIVRVSPTGSDANDGSSWSQAKRSVQSAIDQPANNGIEIWVESGVYPENLTLRHFVDLYGGFGGTETNCAQRNWASNGTVLDGGYAGCVITATHLQRGNTIDGFVIRNGLAHQGAGICALGSSLSIANNTITGNWATNGMQAAGGGVLCGNPDFPTLLAPLITNNLICSNIAAAGGGVFCWAGAAPVIVNNQFQHNRVGTFDWPGPLGGGGVCLDEGIVRNNLFVANRADTDPGHLPKGGGAICVWYPRARTLVTGNTLCSNVAAPATETWIAHGGGINAVGANVEVANNIIAFGSSGLWGNCNFHHNCVYGNDTNYAWTDLTGTNGNISVDPRLVSGANVALHADSPCINAGGNSAADSPWDFYRHPRIRGGTVDIGAYEFQDPSSVISYAWLYQYGLPADGSADYADADGDHATTWQEWQAGTNPTNQVSVFKALSLTATNSFDLTITWNSAAWIVYHIQRSRSLGESFLTVATNLLGLEGTTSYTDTNAITSGPYFYRVGVGVPPPAITD